MSGILALGWENNPRYLGQEGSLIFVHREVGLGPCGSLVVVACEVGLVQEEVTLDLRGEGNERQLRLY